MKPIQLLCSLGLLALSCKTPEKVAPITTPDLNPTPVAKSAAKDVVSFTFSALNPSVKADIGASPKNIVATVPYGTSVKALVPTIIISDKATISPATGVAQDFSSAVIYTVTAEDDSKQTYPATVQVAAFAGGQYRLFSETANRLLTGSYTLPYVGLQSTNILSTDGRENWLLEPTLFVTPDGFSVYIIKNQATRYLLKGKGNDFSITNDKNETGATWTIEPTRTGDYFYIRNRASGYVLVADAQGVRLLPNGGFANERWKIQY